MIIYQTGGQLDLVVRLHSWKAPGVDFIPDELLIHVGGQKDGFIKITETPNNCASL